MNKMHFKDGIIGLQDSFPGTEVIAPMCCFIFGVCSFGIMIGLLTKYLEQGSIYGGLHPSVSADCGSTGPN